MADVKWIKITTDIFDDEKILLIETMPEADSIIVIWFKLLCLAGKNNNSGVFMLSNGIPYTEDMLATIFRRKPTTIKLALDIFLKFGMIEIVEDVITIPKWAKHQNLDQIESRNEYMKNYMQKYREKQKEKIECKVNSKVNSKLNVNSLDKNRIEENRIEEKKEINKEKSRFVKPTLEEIQSYISSMNYEIDANRFYDYYESNGWMVGKNHMKDWKATIRTWQSKNKPKVEKPKEVDKSFGVWC